MAVEFKFVYPLSAGLHARPASHLGEVANRFAADCTLRNLRSASDANAKSVLAIIGADVRQGDECLLQVNGADEGPASAALRHFVERELAGCDGALPVAAEIGPAADLPRALKSAGVKSFYGVAVSRGIGEGRVILVGGMALPHKLSLKAAADTRQEHDRVGRAIAAVRTRIETSLCLQVSHTQAEILKAHLSIASDVSLKERISKEISEGRTAGEAVVEAGRYFVDLVRQSESRYIRERAVDIEEICLDLLAEIYGPEFKPAAPKLDEPSVVIAKTMAPQQLLALDREWLKGLVLESGGTTSHAVILARSLGIPTLTGVKDAVPAGLSAQEAIVDANRGLLFTEVTPVVHRFYARERATIAKRKAALELHASAPSVTVDGEKLEVAANVGSLDELVAAFASGADSVGLFRTEMLFAGRNSAPSEEEQFAIYAQAARAAAGRPVILRTIDVGGDKPLPYLNLPAEANPFLGYRGIRIYPDHLEILHAQLRAILRASAFGRIQLMAPMVSSFNEVLWLKAQIGKVRGDLESHGVAFDARMPVGIMIEVPSCAFILDQLCRELDFFSIGTNDLAQYFLAIDRDNSKVAPLATVRHPGFQRLLKQIVKEAHQHGKWIGMCGEMAGDVRHLPLLIGLGLDEISLAASEIPATKARISTLRAASCECLLEKAAACQDAIEVTELLDSEQAVEDRRPLLDRNLVLFGGGSRDKNEAIREIVDALYVTGRTESPQRMEDAVWARESVYSTGLGFGFAVPHCKTDAVIADSIGILKLEEPIDWGSLDGAPVCMVILLALRESQKNGTHMQVFSKLARKLMDEDFRNQLLGIESPEAVVDHLSDALGIPVSNDVSV